MATPAVFNINKNALKWLACWNDSMPSGTHLSNLERPICHTICPIEDVVLPSGSTEDVALPPFSAGEVTQLSWVTEEAILAQGVSIGITLSSSSASDITMPPGSNLDVVLLSYLAKDSSALLLFWGHCFSPPLLLRFCDIDDVATSLFLRKCHSPFGLMEDVVPSSGFMKNLTPLSCFLVG